MSRTRLILVGLMGLVATTMMANPKPPVNSLPVQGTLAVGTVSTQFKYVTAFETQAPNKEARICIVASSEPFVPAKVEALRHSSRSLALTMFQPFVMVSFTKAGKPIECEGYLAPLTFKGRKFEGKLDIREKQLQGSAKCQTTDKTRPITDDYGFDLTFNVSIPDQPEPGKLAADAGATQGGDTQLAAAADGPAPAGPQACSSGTCDLFQMMGVDGTDSASKKVGTFVIVGTSQRVIRINSSTGECCLLSVAPNAEFAQWQHIQEPVSCSSVQFPVNRASLGPAEGPAAVGPPAAGPRAGE